MSKDLRDNNRRMEHVAIMTFREQWFPDQHYVIHETKEMQKEGDATIGGIDKVEVKHRDKKTYEDYINGAPMKIWFPKAWVKLAKDNPDMRFYHLNSFPEIGLMVVFEVEPDGAFWEPTKRGKMVGTMGARNLPVQVTYTKTHLELWKETQKILNAGGSIYNDKKEKPLVAKKVVKSKVAPLVKKCECGCIHFILIRTSKIGESPPCYSSACADCGKEMNV